MSKKYVLFSLDDEKAKSLGDAISNNTARKIANFLADNEASESEIAKELSLPLNTADYNIKRLVKAGLIEEKKHFFSSKGKRVPVYKVANKLIVLAPKRSAAYSKLKSIIPVFIVAAILTLFLAFYFQSSLMQGMSRGIDKVAENVIEKTAAVGEGVAGGGVAGVEDEEIRKIDDGGVVFDERAGNQQIWLWFLIGSLVAIIGFVIWNWKRL